jgi:alginate O-acetyltransferase complex protein AlgI
LDLFSRHSLIFIAAAVVLCAMPLPSLLKRLVLLVANVAFLASFDPLAPALFAATSVVGFGAAKVAARGGGSVAFAACLAPMLVPLFLPKLGWLFDLSGGDVVGNAVGARAALFIGASYYTLRAMAFAIDAKRSGALHFGFFDFLVYNSFFPTIVSGPIERPDHFAKTFARLGRPSAEDLREAAIRIFVGLLKNRVLGGIAAAWAAPVMGFDGVGDDLATGRAWIALYAWLLYTWFDFAGYSDLAIGVARLFGIKLAENFDNPFLRPSIAEFWRGWHLSLSFWIRDYLFVPMCGRSPSPLRPHLAALASMTLCGVWHGPNPGWALWGLAHGAGLSLHQAWTTRLRKNFKLKKRLAQSPAWRVFGIVATFHFVAFSWTLVIDPYDLSIAAGFWKVLLGS